MLDVDGWKGQFNAKNIHILLSLRSIPGFCVVHTSCTASISGFDIENTGLVLTASTYSKYIDVLSCRYPSIILLGFVRSSIKRVLPVLAVIWADTASIGNI